jgi:formylmethanofuran dehydrogenase subunit E-like metal-binding protein
MIENEMSCLDDDNDDEDDDETGIPTADCWFIRPSKDKQQSSMVIVAYDQFNAVHQQVRRVSSTSSLFSSLDLDYPTG